MSPMPAPALRRLGAVVRARRQSLGLSQERLAERAGLHVNYVGGIERGERNLGFMNLLRLAGSLDLRVSDLLIEFEADAPDP